LIQNDNSVDGSSKKHAACGSNVPNRRLRTLAVTVAPGRGDWTRATREYYLASIDKGKRDEREGEKREDEEEVEVEM